MVSVVLFNASKIPFDLGGRYIFFVVLGVLFALQISHQAFLHKKMESIYKIGCKFVNV